MRRKSQRLCRSRAVPEGRRTSCKQIQARPPGELREHHPRRITWRSTNRKGRVQCT
jgi:hypothetical protein